MVTISRMLAARTEYVLFIGFLALLAWAPLPFASNRVWSAALLAGSVGALTSVWLLLAASGRVTMAMGTWRRLRLPLALLLFVQAWVFLQTLPLPAAWVDLLSPQAGQWHLPAAWLTLSLDVSQTRFYLLRGLTITLAFLLAAAVINSAARLRLVLQVLVISGTLQALYGAFMVLSGLELGFLVEKYVGQGVATGTFVNRNHLAGYLVMCLAAGIGLLIAQRQQRDTAGWRDRVRRHLRLLLSSKARLRIYLAIMVVALVLTRSRTGTIAFFTALSFAGAMYLIAMRQIVPRTMLLLGSIIVIDLLILGRWFGLDKLVQRIDQTQLALEPRVWSNEYTWTMLRDFPLTGIGGGAFYGVFPNYQGAVLPGYLIHAHNDYLEFATELGLPATLLLIAFVALATRSAWQVLRCRRVPLFRGAAFTCLMVIAWAALHSVSDFNLQIPSNALTFVVILSMAFVCRELPRPA